MVQKKYDVRLSSEEKRHLLKVDEGWTATQVATALDIS